MSAAICRMESTISAQRGLTRLQPPSQQVASGMTPLVQPPPAVHAPCVGLPCRKECAYLSTGITHIVFRLHIYFWGRVRSGTCLYS